MRLGLSSGLAYGGFVPSSINLLDFSPAAAYSLRSFDPTADPYVVNVRRSSDNATSGFKGSQITDGTLAAWVGSGNDGFIANWYDQAGNNRHASQTTAASQPKIVSSGTVLTEGSKPCVEFDGSNDYMFTAFSLADVYSQFVVAKFNAANDFIIDGRNTNSASLFTQGGTSTRHLSSSSLSINTASGNRYLYVASLNATEHFFKVNDGTAATGAGGTSDLGGVTIGAAPPPSLYLDGNIQEIVIYDTEQSANRTIIEGDINTYYSIY